MGTGLAGARRAAARGTHENLLRPNWGWEGHHYRQKTSGAGQRARTLADCRRDRLAAQRPGCLLARLERLSAGESGANAQTADALPAGRGRLPGHARGFPDLAGRVGWAE